MSEDEQLAASKFWFAWDDRTTRRALLAAVMSRFLPMAERAFARNLATGRRPVSWPGLEDSLRRNPRNLLRVANGEYMATLEFVVGAAAVLELDVREFFPDTVEWVALATHYIVCTRRRAELEARGCSPREAFDAVRQTPGGTTLDDARAYARAYARELLARRPDAEPMPTSADCQERWRAASGPRWTAVRQVIAQLAVVLGESDRILTEREKPR